ncbi:peptide chain release factor 2 [Xylocopilactobacillus apicola]|uniref:Peptide chain release factor 2 n=1 Tax=Xylocopilactobacillus apicola TaxID=2932184 RepID=A0AAU9CVD5_9LACO|nr:peptide chain release factor 2 [Xylocopilactobacillus apicola]
MNENAMQAADFWSDSKKAQDLINENNQLKETYNKFNELTDQLAELKVSYDLLSVEADEELQNDLENGLSTLQDNLKRYEIQQLLSGKYDKLNAIFEIHPGAGGTESQDWGAMLYRMYNRYAALNGFDFELIDYQDGDEAGLKSATFVLKGYNAYGLSKSEKGVHRLVRISPFNAQGKRQTSFTSVDVIPEIDNSIEIEIRPDDLKIDVYRSSGAGGQHINKTSSAVRITHLPTGLVAASQEQRSQIQNREMAMTMLRSKLYQLEREKKEKEMAQIKGTQLENAWGSQIRSYVFHPYNLVKDHRTGYETSAVTGVMDGKIEGFIYAYLQWKIDQKKEQDID